MRSRYVRLGAKEVRGAKLASRYETNPTLTDDEAFDVQAFGTLLMARFGASDSAGDVYYSYAILDQDTGVRFRAYAAQSGPAYAGLPGECFVDFDNDDYRLKPEVLMTLQDFEKWLTTVNQA